MRIASVQLCSGLEPSENLALMREALTGVDADLVVFPEATMASFARPSPQVAESLDGPFAAGVRVLAREFGVVIAVGMFTPGDEGRCRNTLLVTGVGIETAYHKLHLYDAFGFAESEHVAPGDALASLEVGGVRVGLAICYDIRFPELFKAYARQGCDVVIVPTSWASGPGKVEQWRIVARARALDSTSYVVAVGQADPEASGRPAGKGPLGVGHSMTVDPLGAIVHEAGAGPEVFVVDIHPERVKTARATLPVLVNSRFESVLRVTR